MDLTVEQLRELPVAALMAALPDFLASRLSDPAARQQAARAGRQHVVRWSDAEQQAIVEHLATLGSEIALYEAHPLLRPFSRDWCQAILTDVQVEGAEHLDAALAKGPVVIVGNHLSYVDTQATDAALTRFGRADLADRLVTVAGPKVYSSAFRRFATGCLSTLPVPQSGAVSDAGVSPRELARQAITSLKLARTLPERGQVLQIYPEGTRTRTGRLGSFLKGVHRYLGVPGCTVVPMAHAGTDRIFPLDSEQLHPAEYRIVYGEPIAADDTRQALAASWEAIAALLPEHLQPEADTPSLC